MTITSANDLEPTSGATVRVCTRTGSRVFERSALSTRARTSLVSRLRPSRSRRMTGFAFLNVSVASEDVRSNRFSTALIHARSCGPCTETMSGMFAPGAAMRALATAVAGYAVATFVGSTASVRLSMTTGSGRANAACTAATASAGTSVPTRTPATRTPAGTVLAGGGVAVVVGAVVVAATVVVVNDDVEVDVVTSAITVPESAPATASPSTKSGTACSG